MILFCVVGMQGSPGQLHAQAWQDPEYRHPNSERTHAFRPQLLHALAAHEAVGKLQVLQPPQLVGACPHQPVAAGGPAR